MKHRYTAVLHSESNKPVSDNRKHQFEAFDAIARLLVLLAVCLVLAGQHPVAGVAALSFPGSDEIPAMPDSQDSFETWLRNIGKPVRSRIHGYHASYAIFRDYNLLVYGSPAKVSGNRYDVKSEQYAMLGFSYDEEIVTNSLFPDDSPGGVTRSTPWKWIELDMGQAARISWARLNASEKAIIHESVLTYRNNSYGGMTFSALNLAENSTVVLAPPSWHLGFALYTNHYLPGSSSSIRYATFNGDGGGAVDVACDIQLRSIPAADGKYVIRRGEDAVAIEYDVCGQITSFHGLACDSDIQNRGAGNDQGWVAGTGTGPWTKSLVLNVRRSDLAGASERTFTLQGLAWVVSSLGDIQLVSAERTITVRIEAAEAPFSVQTTINGSIHYFSGQTNSRGQIMPVNPHRFLALEKMNIIMDFTRTPGMIMIYFNQQLIQINGSPGVKHYEASLIIPALPATLSWRDQRLAQPLSLSVCAEDEKRTVQIGQVISDIEITGDIYDIAYAQVGS